MYIAEIINEESTLKNKIDLALTKLREWFEKKIEYSKEILYDIKEKITNKVKDLIVGDSKGRVLTKDLTITQNKKKIVIAKEGTTADGALLKVKSLINKLFTELRRLCDEIVKICKEAIQDIVVIEKIDKEKIRRDEELAKKKIEKAKRIGERKEKVQNLVQDVVPVLEIIGGLVSIAASVYAFSRKTK